MVCLNFVLPERLANVCRTGRALPLCRVLTPTPLLLLQPRTSTGTSRRPDSALLCSHWLSGSSFQTAAAKQTTLCALLHHANGTRRWIRSPQTTQLRFCWTTPIKRPHVCPADSGSTQKVQSVAQRPPGPLCRSPGTALERKLSRAQPAQHVSISIGQQLRHCKHVQQHAPTNSTNDTATPRKHRHA